MTINDPTGRLARWSLYLQAYDFEIIHRKGKKHSNVDALSRPVLIGEKVKDIMQEDISPKSLDPYEDDYLLYYLRHGKHKAGTSKKQVKRVLKEAEVFKWEDMMLKYKASPEEEEHNLIVPPKEERTDIVLRAHLLGHFQIQSTYDRLKEKYYWKNMIEDVKKVISKCLPCIRHQKVPEKEHRAIAIQAKAIFELAGIDLVFGLPETEKGYKGVMVVTEYVSKYPWAVPIRSKTAEEVAEKLFIYISIFGPPKEIISDQGKEFVNTVIKHLAKIVGVEHKITSPYNPRANGLTERFNLTLVVSLKKHAEKDPANWDKWLPYVLLSYRTRIHSATGFTPYQLLFGRSMNTFENFHTEIDNSPIDKRANEIRNLVENLQPKAIENIKEKQKKQVNIQNNRNAARITDEKIPIGTRVTIKSVKIQSKMQPNYYGIFKVSGYTPKGNYYLKNGKNEQLKEAYTRSRLKIVAGDLSEDDEDDHMEVEEIRDFRKRNGKIEYFVKWKELDESECTWEPENHFDTVECIQEFWDKRSEVRQVNFVEKTKILRANSRSRTWRLSTYAKTLISFLIILYLASTPTAFLIKDKFKFCEIHENKAIWDLPNSCTFEELGLETKKDFYFVLNELTNPISGKGWRCSKKIRTVETFKNFIGMNTHEDFEQHIQLSKEDCQRMVQTKTCDNFKMNCNANYCEFSNEIHPKEFEYKWMSSLTLKFVSCEIYAQTIIGETTEGKLYINSNVLNDCKASEMMCRTKNEIVIWDKDIIHSCPYELVKYVPLTNYENILINAQEQQLFQIVENKTICKDISALKTAEGFLLTTDDRVTNLKRAENDIKLIDGLILSELDYQTMNLANLMGNLIKGMNQKVCQLYKTFINLYTKLDDEFFTFYDFTGNEAILYSDQGRIFVPKCIEIDEIDVVELTEKCYVDFPVKLNINNNTISAFLSQEKILKVTSKTTSCNNNYQNLH